MISKPTIGDLTIDCSDAARAREFYANLIVRFTNCGREKQIYFSE